MQVHCCAMQGCADVVQLLICADKCACTFIVRVHSLVVWQGLMPVHCCAMQGRADVVQLLIRSDKDGLIRKFLGEESRSPPSVVNLALANDFIECAEW